MPHASKGAIMNWLTIGEAVKVNAKKYPAKLAFKDEGRSLTFKQLDERTNRLANALLKLGLRKSDKLSVVMQNCVEFAEIYLAGAKAGIVVAPVNWRYTPQEAEYVIKNSDAKALITCPECDHLVNEVRSRLKISPKRFIHTGPEESPGYANYEKLIGGASATEPPVKVKGKDAWVILHTSGTTGTPKGVVRSHESYSAFFLINEVDFSFRPDDYGLIMMPLFHVNSTFYSFVFTYIGAGVYIHRERKFDPAEVLRIIEKERITFSSMIPTHYALILGLSEEERKKYDVSSVRALLTSSAPVRRDMKLAIMDYFRGARLFEAYGSTEAGMVTLLRPEDQLSKLESIGKECAGTGPIKILDGKGREVEVGEIGELYSAGPMMFDCYYKLPEKTKTSRRGEYFSAGDMARKDADGFYYLVDRKDNMIITGGEHVYPSEVEKVIGAHPAVREVAVVGLPHEKWGEAVTAVVVLKQNVSTTKDEIVDYCKDKISAFKKPKDVLFVDDSVIPRTTTGKIVHRHLKMRLLKELDGHGPARGPSASKRPKKT